jgi:hypothetical protein
MQQACYADKNNDHTNYLTEKGKDFQNAQGLYNEILSSRESIKLTLTVPRRKKRETLLWKEFEISYRKDLEVTIFIAGNFRENNFLSMIACTVTACTHDCAHP